MARFKQVNDLLDPSENLTSCDYYDVNNISKLSINENDLSVIHLNISSFPFHINEKKKLFSVSSNVSLKSLPYLKIGWQKATPWQLILT